MIDPGAGQLIAWGGAVVVRATLVLLGAFAISLLLRRSAAASRHALWTVTVGALLAMPVLSPVLPTVPLPLPAGLAVSWGWMAATPAPNAAHPGVPSIGASGVRSGVSLPPSGTATSKGSAWRTLGATGGDVGPASGQTWLAETQGTRQGPGTAPFAAPTESADEPRHSGPATLSDFLLLAWLLGAVVLAGFLILGLGRSVLLCRRSVEAQGGDWLGELRSACAAVRLTGPVSLRFSPQVRTGMAGGLVHPVVLLPETARSWSRERRRIVLLHEVVHLKGRDPLRKICGRIVLALYWFHPLAWCAVRQATLACEEACDEAVVALGHRPSAYARHLVALADPAPHPLPALSRIDRPHLEKRIMKLLATPSRRDRRSVVVACTLAILWALTVAAVSPTGQSMDFQEVPAATGPLAAALPQLSVPSTSPPAPSESIHAPSGSIEASSPSVGAAPPTPSETSQLALDLGCRLRPDGVDFEDGEDFSARGGIQITTTRGNRFIQRSLDGYMICLRTHGEVRLEEGGTRIGTLGEGAWLVLAARGQEVDQRLEVTAGAEQPDHRWIVGGVERPFDGQARMWRDAMLQVLGLKTEIGSIRGEVGRLRGEIGRTRGEEARLRGEIARIRGEEASLRGQVATAAGEEARIRGDLARIRAEESRIRGEIARIRGEAARAQGESARTEAQIGALERARQGTGDLETRSRLEAEIEGLRVQEPRPQVREAEVEAAIAELEARLEDHRLEAAERRRALETRLAGLDTESRVLEVEARLQAQQQASAARIRELQEAVAGLDVEAEQREIERRIDEVDADRRIAALREELETAEARLLEMVEVLR